MSKSPSLRRIQADIRELRIDPSDQYHAAPLESDMFEWHFTIRGASDTEFEGGVYHGRILLPPEYPFKPPHIVFLTPSGRFETHTKVCLSFSAHHPELWQPAWGIRLILEALISFLPTPADGAIGALDWTKEERKKLAKESIKFRCPVCCAEGGTCVDLLPEVKPTSYNEGVDKSAKGKTKTRFQEEIEKLKMLQFQNHAVEEEGKEGQEKEDTKPGVEESTGEIVQKTALKQDDDNKHENLPTESGENTVANELKSGSLPESLEQSSVKGKEALPEIGLEPVSSVAETVNMGTETSALPTAPSSGSASTNNAGEERSMPPEAPAQSASPAPETNGNINVLVSDSFLNGMIAALAIVVVVLFRKAQSLVDELRSLEDSN